MLDKDALQYIVNLSGQTDLLNVDGHQYSVKQLYRVKQPVASTFHVSTLSGLIDYIKSNVDVLPEELLLHVVSPTAVDLSGPIRADKEREIFIEAIPILPSTILNTFVAAEQFIINLQASFLPNEDRAAILKVVGNIKEESVKQTSDDGITQTVTAKAGIARVADVPVPNPVVLAPYRTFLEVKQPVSKFIFRMQDGPRCGLFEADGGAWKITAMRTIKAYLEENLEGQHVKIIA